LPDNWILCRLSAIADIFTGNSINEAEKQKKYMGLDSGYNYIGTKDVGFDHSINYTNGVKIPYNQGNFRIAHINTPLLCIEGGSAGRKIGVLTEDVCFGNKLCAFEPIGINPKYLYYYLQNPIFTQIFKEKTTGIIGGVSVNSLKNLLFAMPPLAEQERIVSEIEKFEPLIVEYDSKPFRIVASARFIVLIRRAAHSLFELFRRKRNDFFVVAAAFENIDLRVISYEQFVAEFLRIAL